jgi:signal transduction histidine kinase
MHKNVDTERPGKARTRCGGAAGALDDLRETTRQLEVVNARLVASEALRTHFLANIRNEINNPLTAILGLAREMVGCAESAASRALGDALLAESFLLDFQMRNILAAAEIEAGEALPRVAQVDVRRIIEDAASSFAPLGASRDIHLETAWSGPPRGGKCFRTDPAKLSLILTNLISNAVKFAPKNSEVMIIGYRSETSLVVRVEDSGGGILPEHRELIFERFRQLAQGPAKSWQGHGLGLAVVQALLEILGGTIEVGDRPGFGSVFTFRVPESALAGPGVPHASCGNQLVYGEELL